MNASLTQTQMHDRTLAPRQVTFDLRVTVPAATPMLDVAGALTQLAAAVNGSWSYRQPAGAERGYFEVGGPS